MKSTTAVAFREQGDELCSTALRYLLQTYRRMNYRIKLRGQSSPDQKSPTVKVLLIAFIGASLAGASLGLLTESSQQALIMGSFGASIFLVMAAPDLSFAQPKNVLAGHFLASAIGLACFHFIGEGFFIMGIALGLTTVAMLFFKVAPPPAGSNPIAIFLAGPDWSFLVTPTLAGALVIVALGIAYNNVWADRAYRKYC